VSKNVCGSSDLDPPCRVGPVAAVRPNCAAGFVGGERSRQLNMMMAVWAMWKTPGCSMAPSKARWAAVHLSPAVHGAGIAHRRCRSACVALKKPDSPPRRSPDTPLGPTRAASGRGRERPPRTFVRSASGAPEIRVDRGSLPPSPDQ
jgi:hypothetical protein